MGGVSAQRNLWAIIKRAGKGYRMTSVPEPPFHGHKTKTPVGCAAWDTSWGYILGYSMRYFLGYLPGCVG